MTYAKRPRPLRAGSLGASYDATLAAEHDLYNEIPGEGTPAAGGGRLRGPSSLTLPSGCMVSVHGQTQPSAAQADTYGKGRQPPRKRGNPERDQQKAVVAWIRQCVPGAIVSATINEAPAASRDPNARARFYASRKAAGAQSGWPDLTICLPGPRVVFLEMKAPGFTASAVRPEQRDLHATLRRMGFAVGVMSCIDDVRAWFEEIGITTREAL